MNENRGKYPDCMEPLWIGYLHAALNSLGGDQHQLHLSDLVLDYWHNLPYGDLVVRELISEGWLASQQGLTRRFRCKFSELARAEIDRLKGHFRNILGEAAFQSNMTLEQLCQDSPAKRFGHKREVADTFHDALHARSKIATRYAGKVHTDLADTYQSDRRGEAKLIKGNLAHVHHLFGRPFLSASAKLLIVRMEAWICALEKQTELNRLSAERGRRLKATRADRLARLDAKGMNKRSSWFDLVPEDVARRQAKWDRCQAALRMRRLGFLSRHIAERFEISTSMASSMVREAERNEAYGRRSPIECYLAMQERRLSERPLDERLANTVFIFSD